LLALPLAGALLALLQVQCTRCGAETTDVEADRPPEDRGEEVTSPAHGRTWPSPPPDCPTVELDEHEVAEVRVADWIADLPYPGAIGGGRIVADELPAGARWLPDREIIEFRPSFIQGGRTYVARITILSQKYPDPRPLCIRVRDSISPPEPTVISEEPGDGFTLLTLSQTTDDFLDSPGYAGRSFGAVLSVPDHGPREDSLPLRVDLHGFHSPLRGDGVPGYFSLYPHDPENTYWWGYSTNLPAGSPDACEARDYTQRRVLHLLGWVLDQYPGVDPARVWVFGNSMGGAGAATIGLRHARHFAYVDARRGQLVPRNHRPSRARQLAGLWGRPGRLGGETCPSTWDEGDLTAVLRDSREARQQFVSLIHGKDDTVVHFGALLDPSPLTGSSFVDGLRRQRMGHRVIWDEAGHADLDPVMGDLWWSNGWQPVLDDTSYLRSDLAFPAFGACSADDDIGTPAGNGTRERQENRALAGESRVPGDTGWDGDLAGAINRYLRWDSARIVDAPDRLEIPIRAVSGEGQPSPGPGYPPTGDRLADPLPLVVDVTPRRIQSFHLAAGEVVRWSYGNRSGTARAGEDGTVTVRGLEVTEEWRVLSLEREGGG